MPINHDRCAPECDEQLPTISVVGRGPKGNSAEVNISDPDTCSETYLEGGHWDEIDHTYHSDWHSLNINGGELSYQYNLRPYTIPRTFTMTFIYRRPGRCEWSWTTPAIPYIWTTDPAGVLDDNPDHIVGSGVATLFIRTMHDEEWNERLHYPEGTTRDDFNSPDPEEGWSATITFGKDGDIEVPDFDDIAKIIGITKEDLYNILEDNSITINGIEASDLVDYIDKCDKRDLDHIHADLGFTDTVHEATEAFGGFDTVKEYIDAGIGKASDQINNLYNMVNAIVAHICGAKVELVPIEEVDTIEIPDDMALKITWNDDENPEAPAIPTGNINVFSGSQANYIRTRMGETDNDIKAE